MTYYSLLIFLYFLLFFLYNRSMKDTSSISSKGQITIPKWIRERFGFLEGTALVLKVEQGRVYIEKQHVDPIENWRGFSDSKLPSKISSTDNYISLIRDENSD